MTPIETDRPFAREVASFLDDREGLYALALHGDERRDTATVCGARIIVEPPDPDTSEDVAATG